jgi:maleylacetate reductase
VDVRWGLEELPSLLAGLGIERPLLVASERWSPHDLPVEVAGIWKEVPSDRLQDAAAAAQEADGILALGGGSAIDLGKAISAETGLPLVSVPTTYSGSEWTSFYGIRDPQRRAQGGGGGAKLAGIVYEPALTMALPRAESVGTALNAVAHTAEALYVEGRNAEADREALAGAALISTWLPRVVENGDDAVARRALLEGAAHAGAALASAGLGLGHAMAQALGGRYGLPHGALNAISLPPALRFNEPVAANEIARFGDALGSRDPVGRVEELARLGGFERLRDLGVPADELAEVAEAAAVRAGARANPRPATPAQIAELLRSVW